jgi:hypothetical protein
MSMTLRAMALLLFVSVCSQAETRRLALYAGPAPGLEAESRSAMRTEVQRLLAPAGIEVFWKDMADRKTGEDFELIAVASFEGSCSPSGMMSTPVAVKLADTSITDGHILPFFRVDCTRVVQLLDSQLQSSMLGRALGRVIAHEIYHIISHTAEHHDTGVAKAVFSARDLKDPRFEFDPLSLGRMGAPPVTRFSDGSDASSR